MFPQLFHVGVNSLIANGFIDILRSHGKSIQFNLNMSATMKIMKEITFYKTMWFNSLRWCKAKTISHRFVRQIGLFNRYLSFNKKKKLSLHWLAVYICIIISFEFKGMKWILKILHILRGWICIKITLGFIFSIDSRLQKVD